MFFFNDTATTEIYTLSLHDALPISVDVVDRLQERQPVLVLRDLREGVGDLLLQPVGQGARDGDPVVRDVLDRKSTRLNSSHANISYAVFCLKKKINYTHQYITTSTS